MPWNSDKHYVVFGRRKDGFCGIQLDNDLNFDNANQDGGHPPIKAGKDFLRVVNIIGNVQILDGHQHTFMEHRVLR